MWGGGGRGVAAVPGAGAKGTGTEREVTKSRAELATKKKEQFFEEMPTPCLGSSFAS